MFNSIRQNLRSFLRIPENTGLPTISASLPTATLGHPPEVSFTRPAPVAPVAPSAAAVPRFRRSPVDAEGFTAYQRKMQHDARLKTEFGLHEKLEAAGMKSESRRKVLADFDRFVAARPVGKAAPSSGTENDDGAVPVETPAADDPVGDVIQKLQQCLQQLKDLHPDVNADDADADEAEARLALAAGRKSEALKLLDSAVGKRGAKIVAKKNRSALLAQPSSRSRASALIRSGFNCQPGVMALNASLGRAPRADFPAPSAPPVLPVAPHSAPAATSSAIAARIRAIDAEIKANDGELRKNLTAPALLAKHSALKSEKSALIKSLRQCR